MEKKANLSLVDPKDETEKIKKLFDELLQKTNKTNPKDADVDALRKLLRDHPDMKLYDRIAGIMTQAEGFIFAKGPLSPGLNAVLSEKQDALREDLGYKEASEMEKLLIFHASVCWLRLAQAEFWYSNVMKSDASLRVCEYWERKLTTAQKRFTRACETLERVRLMARNRPALKLVGQKIA